MIPKIITFTFLLFVLIYAVYIIYDFIKGIINHKKVMRKLDEWHSFHKQLMSWSMEIKDKKVQKEYTNFCINLLLEYTNSGGEIKQFPDIVESYNYVVDNYSHHIPSLLKELRDNKLEKII